MEPLYDRPTDKAGCILALHNTHEICQCSSQMSDEFGVQSWQSLQKINRIFPFNFSENWYSSQY